MVERQASTQKWAGQKVVTRLDHWRQSTTAVYRPTHNDYKRLIQTLDERTSPTNSWPSSRKNFTSIATWRAPEGSRLLLRWHSTRRKLRFGFRTGAWSRRNVCARTSLYRTATTKRCLIQLLARQPIFTQVPALKTYHVTENPWLLLVQIKSDPWLVIEARLVLVYIHITANWWQATL